MLEHHLTMRLIFCLWIAFAVPHGDVHEQIHALTSSIEQYPDSTSLYADRGELFLLDENINAARSDFSTCILGGMINARVFLGLSKCMESLGYADSAMYYVNLALQQDIAHYPSLEWKGSLLFTMQQYCESAEIYSHLISIADHPSPSLYIDASVSALQCPESAQDAEQIIKEGITRLGRLHVLEKELVRVYLHDKKYTEALQVQTEIIDHWSVKTYPYYDRALTYLMAGNKEAAHDDLESALQSIDLLPAYKSSAPALQEMRSKIVSLLQQTGK